jgi:hypothetical protein
LNAKEKSGQCGELSGAEEQNRKIIKSRTGQWQANNAKAGSPASAQRPVTFCQDHVLWLRFHRLGRRTWHEKTRRNGRARRTYQPYRMSTRLLYSAQGKKRIVHVLDALES